jgi:hypothetical protein
MDTELQMPDRRSKSYDVRWNHREQAGEGMR